MLDAAAVAHSSEDKRAYLISVHGARMVLLDCSNTTPVSFIQAFDDYDARIRTQPPGSALVLARCADAHFNPAGLKRWAGASSAHFEHVKRGAFVGLAGLVKVAWSSYKLACSLAGVEAGKKLASFPTEDAGIAWSLRPWKHFTRRASPLPTSRGRCARRS